MHTCVCAWVCTCVHVCMFVLGCTLLTDQMYVYLCVENNAYICICITLAKIYYMHGYILCLILFPFCVTNQRNVCFNVCLLLFALFLVFPFNLEEIRIAGSQESKFGRANKR